MLYLYNPLTNTKTATSYAELEEKTKYNKAALQKAKLHTEKLAQNGCYLIDETFTTKQRRELHANETFKNEVWLKVQGYDGRYYISNYGRVKAYYKSIKKAVFMLPNHDKSKLVIRLCGGDSRKTNHTIASLVAKHFIGPKMPGQVVTHKNGLYYDNFAGNLRYTTKAEVMKHHASRSKPVIAIDSATKKVVGEYRNTRIASQETFFSLRTVSRSCQLSRPTESGIQFMYMDQYENMLGG